MFMSFNIIILSKYTGLNWDWAESVDARKLNSMVENVGIALLNEC